MAQKSSAVILARVSSKSQEDEGYSLDSQLKLLIGYCEKNGLRVCRTFKIAETASKEQSRKVFHEMLAYISKEGICHLAVEKTDRFTRNFRDAVAIDDWLEQDEDRRLHAVKENLLLHKNAKSDVKFMWNIHLSVAKKYTDNLREEAMKGWAEKLAQGWMPHPPPLGYKTITESGKRIHVPNPETEGIVRHIFAKYLETGQTIVSIGLELQRLGIQTRFGKPCPVSYIQKILSNPFYIGINRFNGKDYPGAQETLITRELFDQVQRKMHRGRPQSYSRHDIPLKGLIKCEDCNSVVTWQLQKGHYYGVCRRLTENCKVGRMLKHEQVEGYLREMLAKLVCPSPQVIDWVVLAMRDRYTESIEERERQVKSIETQIERLERMEESLYDDKLAGDIAQQKYDEKKKQFAQQRALLSDQLEGIDQMMGLRLEQRVVLLELAQKAADIYARKSPSQKRLIISKLFSKLTMKEGAVSVEYTMFSQFIAERVLETRQFMEARK